MSLQSAVDKVVEYVGEELATKLLQGLAEVLGSGQRSFDEIFLFLQAEPETPEGAGEEEEEPPGPGPHRRIKFLHGPPGPPGPGMRLHMPFPGKFLERKVDVMMHHWGHPGGRPNVVGFYAKLYEDAQDKEAVLRVAENQLSKTSFWRLKKRLKLE